MPVHWIISDPVWGTWGLWDTTGVAAGTAVTKPRCVSVNRRISYRSMTLSKERKTNDFFVLFAAQNTQIHPSWLSVGKSCSSYRVHCAASTVRVMASSCKSQAHIFHCYGTGHSSADCSLSLHCANCDGLHSLFKTMLSAKGRSRHSAHTHQFCHIVHWCLPSCSGWLFH